MNIESYKAITNDMAKLHKTVVAFNKVYDRPQYAILASLVKNIAVNYEGSFQFNLDSEYNRIVEVKNAVKAMYDTVNSDIIKFTLDQIDFSVEGNLGMEQLEGESTMLDKEQEIFKVLYDTYSSPKNKDAFGQTHISNYSEVIMKKLLTEDAFNFLVKGESVYGKFSTYGNRISTYKAVSLSSKFYEKAISI